jgi:putative DNA base modification enzyme with NMAD domain
VKALLIRVGIDCTDDGHWNGPVDVESGNFVYVPIAETKPLRNGFERLYDELRPALATLQQSLPPNLVGRHMHLDPDFATLTYGDQGRRAAQIQEMDTGDLLIFYASLRAVGAGNLVYALIGVMVIDKVIPAIDIPQDSWAENAHTRRIPGPTDIVVRAVPEVSGRLEHCIPVGEYRDRAYRVRRPLVKAWGGLSVKNGYLQRSARLPRLNDPGKFYAWFKSCHVRLLHKNN